MSNEPIQPAPHTPERAGTIGEHLLADLSGIAAECLTDEAHLTEVLHRALAASHFTVIGQLGHTFPGEAAGVTVILLLAESHASIHTYPECGYAAVDIFSCGTADPREALAGIIDALSPAEIRTTRQRRGADPAPGQEAQGDRKEG